MTKILVSGCLLGENCKYNGGNNYNPRVVEFLKGKEVISICPEMMAKFFIRQFSFQTEGSCLPARPIFALPAGQSGFRMGGESA